MAATWPLVGRASELGYLAERLDRHPAGVLVAGAAGVGKSRLVAEATEAYRVHGGRVARCVASHSAASVPLGVLAPILDGPPASPGLAGRFSAASRAIVERLGGGLLVIDDVHLLDEASAALVHQLASAAEVSLLLTMRTGEPAPDAVDALWKDELLERLELQPLAREETRSLLENVFDGVLSQVASAQLFEASLGNVLFLRELVLDARETEQLVERDGVWSWTGQVPAGPRLMALVAKNLDRLTGDEHRLIELIALLEPLPVEIVERLVPVETLEGAERGGTVVVDDTVQVRLGHPLYGEVVRRAMAVSRMRSHVRDLARAVAASRPDVAPGLDLRLAVLHLESREPAPAGLLELASRRVTSRGDPALGERLARHALVGDADSYAAGHVLGLALVEQGRYGEADDVMASLAGREPDETAVAELARARMTALYFARDHRRADPADVVADAVHRVSAPGERAEILTARAEMHLNDAEFDAALALVEPLLGAGVVNEHSHMRAGTVASMALTLSGRPVAGASVAADFEPAARAAGRKAPGALSWFAFVRWLGLTFSGELDEAQSLCAELLETEQGRHVRYLAGSLHLFQGRIELMRGRFTRAADTLRQSVGALRIEDPRGHLQWALGLLAAAVAATGDLTAADRFLEESTGRPSHARRGLLEADRRLAGAWVKAAAGDLSTARTEAATLGTQTADRGMTAFALVALYDATRLGEGAVRERLQETAVRCEGSLATAIGAHAGAMASRQGDDLAAAGERLDAVGLCLPAAEAFAEAAAAHQAAGRRSPALTASARSAALQSGCGDPRTPILAEAGVARPRLTRREREVVELAARGVTNRDIADRLFTSIRTVEGHLGRAYAKLGVRTRQELPSALGLDPAPEA